jgi:hypothetical protein
MSTTSDRIQRAAAVLIAGAVLFWSAVASHDLNQLVPEPTTPAQIKAVHDGQKVLRDLRAPAVDIQPCDAIKSLFPDTFDRATGNTDMKADPDKPVILCFRNSIDYGDALEAADRSRLFWTTGLGGDTIIAFSRDEATFREVMNRNGVKLAPGDLTGWPPGLDGLKGENGAERKDGVWIIKTRIERAEVFYGPYINITGGRHRLRLEFAPAHPLDCATLNRERTWVAVTRDSRTAILMEPTEVKLQPIAGPGCRYSLTADFDAPPQGAQAVETPLAVQGLANMKLETYSISPIAPAAQSAAPAR